MKYQLLLPHWQGPEELAWLQPLPWHCREATRPCINSPWKITASTTERMHIKNPVVNDVGVQLPVVQLLSVGFFQKLRPFVFQMHNHGSPGKNHGGLKKKQPNPNLYHAYSFWSNYNDLTRRQKSPPRLMIR